MKREWKPLWFNFLTVLLLKKFKHLLRGQLKNLPGEAGEEEKVSSSWHEFSLLNFRVLAFLFAKCRNNPSLLAESRIQERALKYKKRRAKKWFIVLQWSCPVCLWKILVGECVLKHIKKKKVFTFQNYLMRFIYGTGFCQEFYFSHNQTSRLCFLLQRSQQKLRALLPPTYMPTSAFWVSYPKIQVYMCFWTRQGELKHYVCVNTIWW